MPDGKTEMDEMPCRSRSSNNLSTIRVDASDQEVGGFEDPLTGRDLHAVIAWAAARWLSVTASTFAAPVGLTAACSHAWCDSAA